MMSYQQIRGNDKKINIFTQYANFMSKKAINMLKVILADKNVSSKWLAEQLGKNEATISRWCTNDCLLYTSRCV